MIVGVGVDLVQISRVRRSLERFGDRFAGKILCEAEMERMSRRTDRAAWLAKRFAAKEAVAKALGTGMRQGVHFAQILVSRQKGGAPIVQLSGAALARAEALGVTRAHISISDEQDYAVAFAVLESDPDTPTSGDRTSVLSPR